MSPRRAQLGQIGDHGALAVPLVEVSSCRLENRLSVFSTNSYSHVLVINYMIGDPYEYMGILFTQAAPERERENAARACSHQLWPSPTWSTREPPP